MGTDQLRKERAFNILTDPRVAPYVNQQAVIDKFVLEDVSDGDPDEFKNTPEQTNEMLQQIMGQGGAGGGPLGGGAGVGASANPLALSQ
jgi:hypothetical protein